MASSSPQSPPLFLDTLYCSEEHWEEEEEVNDFGFQEKELSFRYILNRNDEYNRQNKPDLVPELEHDLFWEDEELVSLFSKEQRNHDLYKNLDTSNPVFVTARRQAVEWMLKVHAFHGFAALTGVLAVDYFDRFLCTIQFQTEKPWMTQLAAVACLSLAAKVEETQVPLLLDFQIEETNYIFEAKTIQTMEILVLSSLQWRMNPVTPLSYIDFITRKLGFKTHLCWVFLRRCESIMLSLLSDSGYSSFLPSTMATATMLHVLNSVEHCILAEYQNLLLGVLRIDKDELEKCGEFITKLTLKFHGHRSNKRKIVTMPGSPNGVIDVSFSSDSSNDSPTMAGSSVSSSPEPMAKKMKSREHHQHLYNATADLLHFPH